jgi:hypothetical protein
MIIYCHVVVVLVWLSTVVKQFIRALHDVYAMTFRLIVAPTHFSMKGGGREMICIGQRMPFNSHDVGRCDAPLPLHCMLVNALWIIDDPMAIFKML